MNPIDYVILLVIAAILGGVALYLHKAKKKGVKCIGCPSGGKCSGSCGGCQHNME